MSAVLQWVRSRVRRPKFVTRNILLLSLVSFFTDIASEMVYPIIPLYLAAMAVPVAYIGLIEGVANAVTGLAQGWFGYWSDRTGKPQRFVQFGYGISAISKPMLAIFPGVVGWLLGARVLDRFGKAVRSAPRDAILANDSDPRHRGKVFGFHRSLDTFGATLGPIAAVLLLWLLSGNYTWLFLIAGIPGLVSLALTLKIRPGRRAPKGLKQRPPGIKAFKEFLVSAPPTYKRILIGYILLGLVNSSDFFLLLRAQELGLSAVAVVGIYILYNFVYAIAALPIGAISDKFGFRNMYIIGLIVFAGVYGALANELSIPLLITVFAIYGIFTATNDATSKAWLSKHLTPGTQATGIGLYLTLNSLAFLLATAGTGLLWQYAGSNVTFAAISLLSIVSILYFTFSRLEKASS